MPSSRSGSGPRRKVRPTPCSTADEVSTHVVLDYRPALHGRGGIAVYAREIATALARSRTGDRLDLWAHRLRPGPRRAAGPLPPNARLRSGRLPSRIPAVLARFGWGVDRLLGGADVVHWTDYVTLPSTRAPVVATIHDVLFEDLPGCYTARMRAGLRATTLRIVRRAARLLVPSARTRRALVAHFRVDPDRVDTVPHGPRSLPRVPPATEHGPYFLFVGTLEPRKNLMRLLAAHDRLVAEGYPPRLVVAGPRGWMDEGLLAELSRRAHVTYEGPVDAARLAALYGGASALAYPSLGEGFGLPVLEAMARGLPVLVGRETACSDLAGGAGVAVDPCDVDAIHAGLRALLEDEGLRARLRAAARHRARAFTWEAAALATRRSYLRALQR